MFPVRYFPKTYYAPTFFPPGDGDTPGVIYVSVFDAASYADAISKGQFRSLFDTVTGDDSTNTSRIIRSMIVDSVTGDDSTNTSRIIRSMIVDSVGGIDTPSNIRDIVALLSNVLSISDGADANVTEVVRQIIESVGVHDYMNAGFLLTALLSEDVNIHDSVLAFLRTTDIPCIVDSVMSGTPLIKTASGLLIPTIIGRKEERDCNG